MGIIIFFIIALIILVVLLSTRSTVLPTDKGRTGEDQLERKLNALNTVGIDGVCLRNVFVPRKNGSTTEIDILYITRKGMFVIESKNISGYIFGNSKHKQWTTSLKSGRYGSKKYRFFNPIWQNNAHINALRNYCGSMKMFSIVAFGDNCEFMDISIKPEDGYLCHYSQFKDVIKQIWACEPDLYDEMLVDNLVQTLSSLDKTPEITVDHLDYAQNGNNTGFCPACGNRLVLRTAKKGPNVGHQFYGCANYPYCNYILNIEETDHSASGNV